MRPLVELLSDFGSSLCRFFIMLESFWGNFGKLLKSLLPPGPLGALLSALGHVLGLSGARLGPLLGHLDAILGPQEPVYSEKTREQKTLIFTMYFKDFGLSGASVGGSVASWGRLGAVLEPLVGMLGAILSHRGLS